ncbi:MAG: vanadium-dependent haloperoxidase [Saprospiraceae bacterium]|nr:vanadium-dependent haloperoxidase [Saprospiraceae bacterium]MDW8483930.1 vanadium-dependent haloperoxidase [Saprospiraceae bacterium]
MFGVSYLRFIALGAALVFVFSHCEKAPESPAYEPYPETKLDANGGAWKTYVLTSGSEIAVPAPKPPTSAEYLAELADLKQYMANTTSEQKRLARWWGGNAVLRWHEIARELAAEYNVPPNYNPDGKTYPEPDPNNPSKYPRFPFANPPYTARALALLSVAQYDALVAAWHAKFQYKRLAPYKYDPAITPLIPANDLPSYPSEDAVVAVASRELLKLLFPAEKEYLDRLAEEHIQSRLWAGANVKSDLDAGRALGQAVANRVLAYAKSDGMAQAGDQSKMDSIRADAARRGIKEQWHSLDIPERPAMLPLFGCVKTWNFDEATKIALRPPMPPMPGSPEYERDLNELRYISKNRTREQFRIAAYWADGPGSYTPPGHWNRRAAELIYEKQFNELRSARAMALVNTALHDAGVTCWDVKYHYMIMRPTEADRSVKTSTSIPNFPAYTSGHSTFSAAAAEVLSYLFPDHASDLQSMAREASLSRIYGCLHYRFDCEVGLEAGKKVAYYAIQRGRTDGSQ